MYFFRVFGVGLRIFILLLCCGGGGVRVQGSGGSWVEDFGEFGGRRGGVGGFKIEGWQFMVYGVRVLRFRVNTPQGDITELRSFRDIQRMNFSLLRI